MDLREREREWRQWEQTPFSGWDFGRLEGHISEEPLPWDYAALAREALSGARSVLDVGTGGGEMLASLCDAWPARVIATETYPPNARLAHERLSPLGARVVHAIDEIDQPLPFANACFDLVLNRHSSYNLTDYARLLRPGGHLLTQQVDGSDLQDLASRFDARPQWLFQQLALAKSWALRAGFTVDFAAEWQGTIAFRSVGALVYFLKAIPWIVPGFSVDGHREVLVALQEQLDANEPLVYTQRRYLLQAHLH